MHQPSQTAAQNAHVARVPKLPGELGLGCKCSHRNLGGAVLTSMSTPLVCRNTRSSSMRTAMQLACATGAQMLLQRQAQAPSLGAGFVDANPGTNMQECNAVQVLLHGESSGMVTRLDVCVG